MLTPEEIASRQFLVSLRGYDRDEVAAFLREVAREHETLQQRLRELESALAESRDAAAAEAVGTPASASRDAFTALGEETTRVLLAAEESAQAIRERAEERARGELENARREAHSQVEGARRTANKIVAEAERRRNAIAEDIRGLEATREAFVQDLRSAMKGVQTSVRAMQTAPGVASLAGDEDDDGEPGRGAAATLIGSPAPVAPAALAPAEPDPSSDPAETVEDAIGESAAAHVEADTDHDDAVTRSAVAQTPATLTADEIADVLAERAAPSVPSEAEAEPAPAEEREPEPEPEPAPADELPPEPEPQPEPEPEATPADAAEVAPDVAAPTEPDTAEPEEAPAPEPEAGVEDVTPPATEPDEEEQPSEAEAPVESGTPTTAEPAEAPADADTAAEARGEGPDVDPLELRTESLAQVRPGMLRRLKRGLQDVQNGVLDGIRQANGAPEVESVLPSDDDLTPLGAVSEMFLTAAYRAGVADGAILVGRDAPEEIGDGSRVPASLATFRAVLSHEITASLRATLRAGIEAGEPDTSLSERVGEVFRDLKGPVVEQVVDQGLARVYGFGQVDVWRALGVDQAVWVVGPEPRCPANRCRVNEQEGPVAVGGEYPSGDTVPPAHDGCTCGLAPR